MSSISERAMLACAGELRRVGHPQRSTTTTATTATSHAVSAALLVRPASNSLHNAGPSSHGARPRRTRARRPFLPSPTHCSISIPMPPQNRWLPSTSSTCSASLRMPTRVRLCRRHPRSHWVEQLRGHFSAVPLHLIISQMCTSLSSSTLPPPCNSPPMPLFSPPSLPLTHSNPAPYRSSPPCNLLMSLLGIPPTPQ